jgi:FHS family glucose/mannose:H+ symporter-like MFS transporter
VLAVAYWAYVVDGVLNSEIGPSLPGIVHSFRIDLATAGTIFTAQFLGYLPGALGSGLAADLWGYRRLLIPATLLIAAGTAGMALIDVWPVALVLTAMAGFGFGTIDSLGNAVVAAEAPREGGAALNLLHTFFGVGALVGPLLVGALLATRAGWHTVFLVTGALAFSCTLLFILVPIPQPAHLTASTASSDEVVPPPFTGAGATGQPGRHRRLLWLLGGLLFLYVGMEQLAGGWSTTYLNRALGTHVDVAARSVALYWSAVTIGRLLASGLALRLSNERLLGGSAALALVAFVALATAGSVVPALVALGVLGLGFAPIYPTIMAITARRYPRRFATIAGLLVAAGGLGGAIFPWVGGVSAQGWGLRATMWLGAGSALALLAIFGLFLAQSKPGDEGG